MSPTNRLALSLFSAALMLSLLTVPSASAQEIVDTISPTTVASIDHSQSHWVIALTATDEVGGSGVAHTYYLLDRGPVAEGTSVSVRSPGPHTLVYWSVDTAGNVETAKIDAERLQPLDQLVARDPGVRRRTRQCANRRVRQTEQQLGQRQAVHHQLDRRAVEQIVSMEQRRRFLPRHPQRTIGSDLVAATQLKHLSAESR